jgi:hypothetical protein
VPHEEDGWAEARTCLGNREGSEIPAHRGASIPTDAECFLSIAPHSGLAGEQLYRQTAESENDNRLLWRRHACCEH